MKILVLSPETVWHLYPGRNLGFLTIEMWGNAQGFLSQIIRCVYFWRLCILHGDKCSKRHCTPLAKLLSQFRTFPGRLGMWGRHRRVDKVNIMQNQPSLDCKSLSSLSVLPFLSGFLRQSFIGTLLYEMLGPEFLLTCSGLHNSCCKWFCSRFGRVVTENVMTCDIGCR